jgi:excisionase family DNA binding protein
MLRTTDTSVCILSDMNCDDCDLITVREAARRLGLRESTIRAWLQKKRLAKVKLGRAVRIPVTELQRLIREGHVAQEEK